jgi:hypothetical protein
MRGCALASDLESTLGIDSPGFELDALAQVPRPEVDRLRHIGFLTAWEVQSQVATACLLMLVVFVPLWCAVSLMIVWSLAATFAYHQARLRGLPDLLATTWQRPPTASAKWGTWLYGTSFSLLKAWAAGLQPLLFARAFGTVLARPAQTWSRSVLRCAIVFVGCTLFGVTAAHHLLARLGLERRLLLRFSLVGPFLNVPYRVVLSAFTVNGLGYMLSRLWT